MTWMEDLRDHIVANSLGVEGETLFIGTMKAEGDGPITALARYKGREFEVMGPTNGVDVPMLQVAVRGTSYADAEERIVAVRNLLRAITNQTVGGTRFMRVQPDGTIKDLKRDSNGRQQFTTDFEVWIEGE